MASSDHPHQNQPVYSAGPDLRETDAVLIMLHGRGATAQSILRLAEEIAPDGLTCLAPQAAQRTWYPRSFLSPIQQNEPYLTSALQAVDSVIQNIEHAGVPRKHIALLGFSQGACLSCEYVAQHPQRYGGIIGLSGGLIGPEDEPLEYDNDADLDETPIFLGCSDQDPHIPLERVQDTSEIFESMNAEVDTRIYPGMGHTTNDDELRAARNLLTGLLNAARSSA